jgi:replicative DNA helicase
MIDFTDIIANAQEVNRPELRVIEETLLKAVLSGRPELITRVISETRPREYYFDLHRQLADKIYPDISQGKHVDKITLTALIPEAPTTDKEKVKERQSLLDLIDHLEALDIPEAGKVESYLSIFVEEARRQAARESLQKIQSGFEDQKISPAEAFAKANQVIMDQDTSRRMVGAFKSEAEDWPTYFAALEANQDPTHKFTGLDTGYTHLNNLANGLPEGLFVVGAAPSTGKTTWAKQVADQIVELNPKVVCLFISLEQSREELRVKTLSRLSTVENRDILRGRLDINSPAWKRVKTASDKYTASTAGRFFILEGDKTTTPERIRLAGLQVRRATNAEDLLIVVDYLQIIPTIEDFKDPRSRIDSIMSELRRIARDLGATVMAISSVGRASYDTAGLSSFKESGGIEYAADLGAIMLPRKNGDDSERGKATLEGINLEWIGVDLVVVKNRNGERGKIEFQFFPQISRFKESGEKSLPDAFEAAGKEGRD